VIAHLRKRGRTRECLRGELHSPGATGARSIVRERRSARASPAEPTGSCSMSPMSRPPAGRSTASFTSIWNEGGFPGGLFRSPGRGPGARLIGTVRDERADHGRHARLQGRQRRARDRQSQGRHSQGETGFSAYHVHHPGWTEHFPQGAAPSCLGDARPYPQPGGRTGG